MGILGVVNARWAVWICHEAFGVECRRPYVGTELGAKRLAARLARAGGYGWSPRWEEANGADSTIMVEDASDFVSLVSQENKARHKARKA